MQLRVRVRCNRIVTMGQQPGSLALAATQCMEYQKLRVQALQPQRQRVLNGLGDGHSQKLRIHFQRGHLLRRFIGL